jgi:hypothetical protein
MLQSHCHVVASLYKRSTAWQERGKNEVERSTTLLQRSHAIVCYATLWPRCTLDVGETRPQRNGTYQTVGLVVVTFCHVFAMLCYVIVTLCYV